MAECVRGGPRGQRRRGVSGIEADSPSLPLRAPRGPLYTRGVANEGTSAIRACEGGSSLRLRVKPRAAVDGLLGYHGGALKLAVKEAPEKGKANRSVCELLARCLGLPVASVHMISGEGSRDKIVRIDGVDPAECLRRLEACLR